MNRERLSNITDILGEKHRLSRTFQLDSIRLDNPIQLHLDLGAVGRNGGRAEIVPVVSDTRAEHARLLHTKEGEISILISVAQLHVRLSVRLC